MRSRNPLALMLPAILVSTLLLPRSATAQWRVPSAQLRVPQVPVAGGLLQEYFDGVGEYARVATDQRDLQALFSGSEPDVYFSLQISVIAKPAGASIGVYDATAVDPELIEVVPPEGEPGWLAFAMFRSGPTRVQVVIFDERGALQQSHSYPGGNTQAIGIYLQGPEGRFYSQDARNPASDPQMLFFSGQYFACSWWASGESTSLSGGADGDFDDLIVRFDSAHWCPDPVSRSTWGAVKSRFR
jgi:hypothetical protein